MLIEGSTAKEYEPYNKYKINIINRGIDILPYSNYVDPSLDFFTIYDLPLFNGNNTISISDNNLNTQMTYIANSSIDWNETTIATYPITISDNISNVSTDYKIYGNSIQTTTPNIDNKVDFIDFGDKIKSTDSDYTSIIKNGLTGWIEKSPKELIENNTNIYRIKTNIVTKNLIPYPYKDSAKVNSGIIYTILNDRSIHIQGTDTGITNQVFNIINYDTSDITKLRYFEPDDYTIIFNQNLGGSGAYFRLRKDTYYGPSVISTSVSNSLITNFTLTERTPLFFGIGVWSNLYSNNKKREC